MAYRTGIEDWINDDSLESDSAQIPNCLRAGRIDFFSLQPWFFEPKSRLASTAVRGVDPGFSQRLLWLIDQKPREINSHLLCFGEELSLAEGGASRRNSSKQGFLATYEEHQKIFVAKREE